MTTTLPAPDVAQLERLSDLPAELALQRSVPLLAHLARDPAFLDAYVLPLLPEAGAREDWYVAHTFDGQDGSFSLQVFVWPAGTQIHDHTSWGPIAAWWDRCSKSATNAWTTARGSTMLA